MYCDIDIANSSSRSIGNIDGGVKTIETGLVEI